MILAPFRRSIILEPEAFDNVFDAEEAVRLAQRYAEDNGLSFTRISKLVVEIGSIEYDVLVARAKKGTFKVRLRRR